MYQDSARTYTTSRRLKLVVAVSIAVASTLAVSGPAAAAAPVFVIQPSDQVTTPGGGAFFSAEVSDGDGVVIDIQSSTDGGLTWTTRASCENSPSCGFGTSGLQLSNSGTLFRFVASNSDGATISRIATLWVCEGGSCWVGDLQASPSIGLVTDRSISLTGSGFPASATVRIAPCVVGGLCELGSLTTTDADGDLSATVPARRVIFGQNCQVTDGCEIRAFYTTAMVAVTPVSFIDVQPDTLFKVRGTGELFFDDVYENDTASAQQRGHRLVNGAWTFALRIQNDGASNDDVLITELSAPANFSIRYNTGYYDITNAVHSGGFRIHDLPPGAMYPIGVTLNALTATPGTFRLTVQATSTMDSAVHDTIGLYVIG